MQFPALATCEYSWTVIFLVMQQQHSVWRKKKKKRTEQYQKVTGAEQKKGNK